MRAGAACSNRDAQSMAVQSRHPEQPATPGVLSGRVFVITKMGDIKPARMAHVYLIHNHPFDLAEWDLEAKQGDSAGLVDAAQAAPPSARTRGGMAGLTPCLPAPARECTRSACWTLRR